MKKIILFTLLSAQLSLYAQFAQPTTFDSNKETMESFFLDADYIPTYYRLEMNLNPYQESFSGKTTMRFKTTQNTSLIKINAQPNLNIESIYYHSIPITNYSRNGTVLSIQIPNSLPENQLDSISISFSGNASNSSGLNLGYHSGIPIIETLAEPWHASSWWVCKDDLVDKVEQIDIFITHPSEFKAAANGVLKSFTPSGNGNTISHWRHNYSIPSYLVGIAVTNYVEYNNTVDISGTTVPIINYVYPETLSNWTNSLDAVPNYIEFLSEKFGDYPYKNEKYGHAQWNRGGGMEHSTMSFMGGFGFDLVVHELAHQWFGNKVTCSTWNHIWINEGFADYCPGLMIEELNGSNSFKNWKQNRINIITDQTWGSVYNPEENNESRIFNSRLTYRKGSMAVHLIRFILNDDPLFFQSLTNFLNDPAYSYGYASTEDLKMSLENSTNRNWDNYFNQWIYGEGHPIFDIELNHNTSSDNYSLHFEQSTSHPSVSFFETPFEIKFNGNNGQSEIRRYNLTQNNQSFLVEDLPFTVTSYIPNPNADVICEINSAELNTNEFEEFHFSVYPNPAIEQFTVQSSDRIDKIQIFNALGQIIYSNSEIQNKELKISSHSWSRGYYTIHMYSKNKKKIKKLLIK